jgi:murein DD-endopeptidase MepM/ murein hydrolase activator NlpD
MLALLLAALSVVAWGEDRKTEPLPKPSKSKSTPAARKTPPATDKERPADKPSRKPESDPPRKKAAPADSKPAAKPAQTAKAAPERKPASRQAKAAKPVARESGGAGTPTTGTGTASARGEFEYDPYGLSLYFRQRADLLSVLPTPAEAARYRLDSATGKARELQRILNRYTQRIESREENIRKGAAAIYLLGRAQRTPSQLAPSVTAAHLLVLRSTVKGEALALPAKRADGAAVSAELDRTADLARRLEAAPSGDAARIQPHAPGAAPAGVTEALVDRANRETRALLDERSIGTAALLAVLRIEEMTREDRGRQHLQAFAPPPPMDAAVNTSFVPPATPMPREAAKGKTSRASETPLAPPPAHGSEIEVPEGTAVIAAADGKVGYAGPFRGYGNLVILEHAGNLFSVYGYLDQVQAEPGKRLSKGEHIGTAGVREVSGAPGFYFEVRKGELPVPAKDLVGEADLTKLLTD